MSGLRPGSLDPLPCNLTAVETRVRGNDGILVLVSLYWLLIDPKYNLDVAWVALVRIDSTVRTICAASCFLSMDGCTSSVPAMEG